MALRETDEIFEGSNLVQDQTVIKVARKNDATSFMVIDNWDTLTDIDIHWSKYQIKETDRRQKTASFSSPDYYDLTTGQYVVLITSPYHEDFGGFILSVDYNEDTGMYDYQCQDSARKYMNKTRFWFNGTQATLYDLCCGIITQWKIQPLKITPNDINKYSKYLAGLLPAVAYEQGMYGSTVNFNPMTAKPMLFVKDKREYEVLQDLVYGTGAYIDIYFDKYGILHIEPYDKKEWESTGLRLVNEELTDRKLKFDTTDVITQVLVGSDDLVSNGSQWLNSKELLNLNLKAFFGNVGSYVNVQSNTTKAATTTTTNTANTTNGNPYNSKAKKIWINSDNGSNDMKNSIINLLKNKGWTVKDGGTCSNCHYSGYGDVTKDYAVYATLYNGFCAGTIQEAYSSSIQNKLKNKGVQLVIMWDTRTWTNPQGMAPYKNGDFSGYTAKRAWDDNFSSSDPTIKNVAQWLKSKDAKYCCGPTANQIVEQFLAGGYFKWANK